ncbi:MAG: hypothetical protein KIH08_15120, partial [Candidatus Freyarchaeota archaeon]|nr:hypothetical protein [Candidatus Jordarchaeia archaeon]
ILDFESRRVEFEREIGLLEAEIRDFKVKLKEVEGKLVGARNEYESVLRARAGIVELKNRIADLRRMVQEEGKWEGVLDETEKKLVGVQGEISEVEKRVEDFRVRLVKVKEEMVGFEVELARKRKELQEVEARCVKVEEARANKKKYEDRIKELRMRCEALEKEMESLKHKKELYGWWVTGFKKLRIFEMVGAVDALQRVVDKYMNILFDGRVRLNFDVLKLKKTAKSDLDIRNEVGVSINDGYVPVEGMSGGEKQLIGIAVLLALNDLFGYRVVFLDEVFGSLDDMNRERVLKLLEFLRGEKMCIVISHVEQIKNLVDWDAIWLVRRRGGSSSFEVVR